ncbi:MAG: DUF1080 domain-containing protein [Opitutia bacterium]
MSLTRILSAALACAAASLSAESLFNGKDLSGWRKPAAEGFWKVEGGSLVGLNDPAFADYKKGSMLYTEKEYQDVVVECEVRFEGEIDSGIMVRRDASGKKDIQMQIGVSRSLKKDMTCAFYIGKYPESGWAPKVASLWKQGEWNRIRFQAKGDTYTVWLNGEQVSNYVDAGYPKAGPVGLQVHGGLKMRVEYRNVSAQAL